MPGVFISFEGGEGAGKSTQIARLAAALRREGHEVVVTLEPGGTDLGQAVRRILLTPGNHVTPRAEALLYAADRAHHVQTIIEPALAEGKIVICDRYADSTFAYQGAGRALEIDQVRGIMGFAVAGRWPDLTLLLDVDPRIGLSRARGGGSGDRMEAEGLQFHDAVRRGFLDLAESEPARFRVIDASGSLDDVTRRISATVSERLQQPRVRPEQGAGVGEPDRSGGLA